jgi:hypothetical protein
MVGRRKRDGNHSHSQNKLIQDLGANEENSYPVPDFNKTEMKYAKEPKEAHKNTMKEEILQIIMENFLEMILDMANQNIQEALKNSKTTKIKNMRRHKKK